MSDNPGVKKGVALEVRRGQYMYVIEGTKLFFVLIITFFFFYSRVQLGWSYNMLEHTHIDTFEEKRSKERSPNFMKEKKLTKHDREKILREFGATEKEIQEAAKRAAVIRNARKKSIEMRQHDKLHEQVESFVRSIKRAFSRKKSSITTDEIQDLERLHPTLMAMMGIDDSERRP